MIIMKDFREYPDGSDILLSLLNKFSVLEEEQVSIFFTQTDKTFNRARVNNLVNTLIKMDVLRRDGEYLCLPEAEEIDVNTVNAFWVLLHYLNKNTKYDKAEYPSEIVFTSDDSVSEIVVMDDESLTKMDFLSKRKVRRNNCHYIFLFVSGTIDEFDDELFPDMEVTLVTIADGPKGIPKLTYHEVD